MWYLPSERLTGTAPPGSFSSNSTPVVSRSWILASSASRSAARTEVARAASRSSGIRLFTERIVSAMDADVPCMSTPAEATRPWWRGLDVEVREALEAWGGADLERLEIALARRVPGALVTRGGPAELSVAWEGVEGRSEVRVLVEHNLRRGADLPRAGR